MSKTNDSQRGLEDIRGRIPQAAKASAEIGGNIASMLLPCCGPLSTPPGMDRDSVAWGELSPTVEAAEVTVVDAEVKLNSTAPFGACTNSLIRV